MQMKIDILSAEQHAAQAEAKVLQLTNDQDPLEVSLDGVARIELHFPKFTDGRAYSQAYLLRRRRGFAGDIRATGDVLVDQVVLMQRTGFSSAVLKDGKDPADIPRQFERFGRYYQGDVHAKPHFVGAV